MSVKNKSIQIYLAGAMNGLTFNEMNAWRKKAKEKLLNSADLCNYNAIVINPVDFYNYEVDIHQSDKEVEDYDLALATSSDLLLVDIRGLDHSIGTIIEIHDCNFHRHIPVIVFGDIELYENLHPWIRRDITRFEYTIDDAINYISDFYMI